MQLPLATNEVKRIPTFAVNSKMQRIWKHTFENGSLNLDLFQVLKTVAWKVGDFSKRNLYTTVAEQPRFSRNDQACALLFKLDDLDKMHEANDPSWKLGVHGTHVAFAAEILRTGSLDAEWCRSIPFGVYTFDASHPQRQEKSWCYAPCLDIPILNQGHLAGHLFVRARVHVLTKNPATVRRDQWISKEAALPVAIEIEVLKAPALINGHDSVDATPTWANPLTCLTSLSWLHLDLDKLPPHPPPVEKF